MLLFLYVHNTVKSECKCVFTKSKNVVNWMITK